MILTWFAPIHLIQNAWAQVAPEHSLRIHTVYYYHHSHYCWLLLSLDGLKGGQKEQTAFYEFCNIVAMVCGLAVLLVSIISRSFIRWWWCVRWWFFFCVYVYAFFFADIITNFQYFQVVALLICSSAHHDRTDTSDNDEDMKNGINN